MPRHHALVDKPPMPPLTPSRTNGQAPRFILEAIATKPGGTGPKQPPRARDPAFEGDSQRRGAEDIRWPRHSLLFSYFALFLSPVLASLASGRLISFVFPTPPREYDARRG